MILDFQAATPVTLRPVIPVASFLSVGVPVWEIRDAGEPAGVALLVRNAGRAWEPWKKKALGK